MGNVKDLVIGRMYRLFGPPNTIAEVEQPAFFREYHDSLSGFADEVLTKGMDWVRDNHDTTFWPPPGVINKACRRFLPSQVHQSSNWDDGRFTPNSEVSREHVRRVHEQFKQAMAAKAMPKPDYIDTAPLDASRPSFEKMQREGDPRLHMTHDGLTELSRRMSGDTE